MVTELGQRFVEIAAGVVGAYSRDVFHSSTARERAAYFLGRLLERNGTTMEEIVSAAAEANTEKRLSIPMPERALTTAYGIDLGAFFRAVATEALGGAKVADTFGEILLEGRVPRDDDECATCPCVVHLGVCGNSRPGGRCKCTTSPNRYAFEVPTLESGAK